MIRFIAAALLFAAPALAQYQPPRDDNPFGPNGKLKPEYSGSYRAPPRRWAIPTPRDRNPRAPRNAPAYAFPEFNEW